MKLTALIADDEELARRLIREYLARHADIDIVAECENGLQTVGELARCSPQLVFLDIQMPKLTGLEVLEASGRRSGVIFTTAYDEYALKAFDLHAVDYLLKPFAQERFDQALEKARRQLGRPAAPTPAAPALEKMLSERRLDRILLRERGQLHVIPVESVDYIEAQDDYILIHAADKSWMKTQSLSELEKQLDPRRFIRVHRSFLLNIERMRSIERQGGDGHVAVLQDGRRVPVSRAGHERLKTAI
ncbi:MAG: LytTR family transcriptional regulator DNA-binding domain-containing protein [Burkholderiaceae bacterium]|nr:LytTR family transcriptional regulator DNA-binding domain-containing protein [Burkholderiaceae bacterium]